MSSHADAKQFVFIVIAITKLFYTLAGRFVAIRITTVIEAAVTCGSVNIENCLLYTSRCV